MNPLAPAVKSVWRIKIALFWGVLLLIVAIFDMVGWLRSAPVVAPGLLTGTGLILSTSILLVIPSLRYRFWRYELRASELVLTRGILNRVHTTVPLRRIQHLDVSQDVIERNFGLGKLVVHTAGTQGSSVVVPGLDFAEAERLRSEIKHFINEYAV